MYLPPKFTQLHMIIGMFSHLPSYLNIYKTSFLYANILVVSYYIHAELIQSLLQTNSISF